MQLQYLLLADAARPRELGKVDLFGAGVEAIFTQAVPAVHSALTVAARLAISPAEATTSHVVEVTLSSPDGETVAGGRAEVQALNEESVAALPPGGHLALPLLLPLANIVFPVFGKYELVLTWDGEPGAASVQLEVAPRPPQTSD